MIQPLAFDHRLYGWSGEAAGNARQSHCILVSRTLESWQLPVPHTTRDVRPGALCSGHGLSLNHLTRFRMCEVFPHPTAGLKGCGDIAWFPKEKYSVVYFCLSRVHK